jgi:aspartyl protease family protein
MTRILLAALLSSLSLVASAQLYKCKQVDGSSTFQDTPCPASATSTTLSAVATRSAQAMTLSGDSLGHFHTRVAINDVDVEGVIDTGASMLTISAATAHQMGISLENSRVGQFQTANGSVYSYIKIMPLVKVGNIELYNVEVSISQNTPTLIGMSALKHFKINEENGQLVLTKQW